MTEPAATELETARGAMTAHAWNEARGAFLAAEQAASLAPADLEMLAEAEWWSGNPEARTEILERAYAAYVEAGQHSAAAAVALRLSETALRQLAVPVAMGWAKRAERMLEGEPLSAVHASAAMFSAFGSMISGDLAEALPKAEQAVELARTYQSRDDEALALNVMGQILVKSGDVGRGLALVDESTTAAVGGELRPWATANVYCGTMDVCRSLSDWERAGAWTEVADREMRRQHITGYPGACRVHRAEVKRLRGDWAGAEEEARLACEELERYRLLVDLGWGYYELGEVRRQMGDATAAEAAYQKAHEYGRDPEPGLALLRLAQGDSAGAATAIRRALSVADQPAIQTGDNPGEPLGRSHLLPAQVRIALAVGDIETANVAATELESIASHFGSTALQAVAASSRGAVLLAQDQPAPAIEALLRGRHLWQVVGAPYEVAQVRIALAAAYMSVGEETDGLMELESARSTYERLGAVPDLRAVEAELKRHGATRRHAEGARVTKTFMFTDIVTSTDLLEALGDRAWEDLIGWHDSTLRTLIARHHGEEVSHTGDGFFVAFEEGRAAIDAAVDIQRTLLAHRHEHGFAPWVRIGLHRAEVSRAGSNYRGLGVHVAARVSALADRDQIFVSAATAAAAGTIPYPVSDSRSATLKGIKGPIELVSLDWS